MSVSNFSYCSRKKLTQFLFTAAFVAGLSACGGGGGGGSGSATVDDFVPGSGSESEVNTGTGEVRSLVLVSQPADVVVPEGKSYSFSVNVDHTHPVTVEWFKDGETINISDTNTYSVEAMTALAAGTYGCSVSDGVLTQDCEDFTVSISEAASASISIVEQPSNQMVNEGVNVVLDVQAQGSDAFEYQWYFDGVAIEGANSKELLLSAVSTANAGDYYVVVTGSGASAQSEAAELVVTETAVTASALIRWQKPDKRADGSSLDESEIAGYEIYYSDSETGTMESLATLEADADSYETPDLGQGDHYFALQTVDQSGLKSALSDPIRVTVN